MLRLSQLCRVGTLLAPSPEVHAPHRNPIVPCAPGLGSREGAEAPAGGSGFPSPSETSWPALSCGHVEGACCLHPSPKARLGSLGSHRPAVSGLGRASAHAGPCPDSSSDTRHPSGSQGGSLPLESLPAHQSRVDPPASASPSALGFPATCHACWFPLTHQLGPGRGRLLSSPGLLRPPQGLACGRP